jgi:hypothetical protein
MRPLWQAQPVPGLPRAAVLLLAALGAAGCGGGGGGAKQAGDASPKAAIVKYLLAFNRGDGSSACSALTPQARAGVPHLSDKLTAPDCEGAIRELSRVSEHLRAPRVSVRLQGDRAIAKIKNTEPPYQSDVLLTRQDGGWRIAYPPAVLERYKSPPGIPSDLPKDRKKK